MSAAERGAPALSPQADALLWAGLHSLAFASSTVAIKLLSTKFPVLEQLFSRALVGLAVLLVFWRGRERILYERWPLLLFRGVTGFVGVFCMFYTVSRLPLVVAMILTLATPIFVLLLGALALKERLEPGKLVWGVLVLGSIFLVAHPSAGATPSPGSPTHALDVAIGLFGSLATAAAFVSMRAALRTVGVRVVMLYFLGCNAVLSLLLGGAAFVAPNASDLAVLGLLGGLGVLSDACKTRAYKHAMAGLVSILSLMSVALAAMFGWALFGEPVGWTQAVGVAGLLLGILFLTRPDRTARAAPA